MPLLIDPSVRNSQTGKVSHEKLSELDLTKINDSLLLEAESIARSAYANCGGNDGAAKGNEMKEKTLACLAGKLVKKAAQ